MSDMNSAQNNQPPQKPAYWILYAIGIAAFLGAYIFGNAVEWGAYVGILFYLVELMILAIGAGFIYLGIKVKKAYKAALAKESKFEPVSVDENSPVLKWIGIVFIIGFIGFVIIGCVDFFSDIDSGPDYTTYYNDENGNGKLDRGEGNYTTDEDGNVVDWDEDNNNWE